MRWLPALALACACSSNHASVDAYPLNESAFDAPPLIQPVVAWEDDSPGNNEIYVRTWNGTSWQELAASASGGGVSQTMERSEQPVIAVMPDGHPVVAWIEYPGSLSQLYVRRWNDTAWEELGGSASGNGVSQITNVSIGAQAPSIAIDRAGRIVVAWQQLDAGGSCCDVYMRRWNGTSWEELGQSATGTGLTSSLGGFPSVAIDPQDRIVVAWQDSSGPSPGCPIFVKRWTGAAWEELASSASGSGISGTQAAADPSVAIGRDGNPVVVFPTDFDKFEVRRFDGAAWQALGPATTSIGCTAGLVFPITVDAADHPLVRAYTAGVTWLWDGATWQMLPSSGGSDGAASLSPDGTGVLAAYPVATNGNTSSEVYVRRWNGTAWEDLGTSNVSNTASGYSFLPSVAGR